MKSTRIFVLITVAVLAFDQLTKLAVRTFAVNYEFSRYFSIRYAENTGALFGFFKDNAAMLAWLGVIAAGLLLYFYKDVDEKALPQALYAFVLAGVLGNATDRFFLGGVTDFISLGFWPAFNFADAAATAGVLGLIAYYLKKNSVRKRPISS